MKTANLIQKTFIFVTLVTLCVSLFAVSRVSAQSNLTAADTFIWDGELVALDEASHILTVKCQVVADQPMAELKTFKPGDRVLLTWSGYDKYASGINHAVRYDASKEIVQRFSMPVEFVAYDSAIQYVTFKTPVPADSAAKIKALKAGEWVTAASPQKKTAVQPILAIRPYVVSQNEHSN